MQPASNPNSSEKLTIQPQFPKPNESRENAMDSCPRFSQNKINPSPNGLSPQHNSGSHKLAPSENQRAALSLDKAVEYELKHGRRLDPKLDKKKLRRIVSNRLSAQRARVRKAKYVNEMEKMAKHLEEMISILTSRVEGYKERRNLLLLQNESLQRFLEFRLNEANLSEIELQKNRMELSRLKELEKALSKNSHDLDAGGQQMHDLISKQLIIQQPGSATKLPVPVLTPKKNQGEAEVDQYLNLED